MGRRDTDKLAMSEEDPGHRSGAGFLGERAAGPVDRGGTLPRPWPGDPTRRVFNTNARCSPRRGCVRATTRSTCSASTTAANAMTSPIQSCSVAVPCAPVRAAVARRPPLAVGLSSATTCASPSCTRALLPTCCWCPAPSPHVTGQAHWEHLLRARAVENLALRRRAGAGGVHENGRPPGAIFRRGRPWGRVLAQRSARAKAWTSSISIRRLASHRQRLPRWSTACCDERDRCRQAPRWTAPAARPGSCWIVLVLAPLACWSGWPRRYEAEPGAERLSRHGRRVVTTSATRFAPLLQAQAVQALSPTPQPIGREAGGAAAAAAPGACRNGATPLQCASVDSPLPSTWFQVLPRRIQPDGAGSLAFAST